MVLQAPVPESHLTALGRMTVNFALLESQLALLAGLLVSNDQRLGQIITADLSFGGLRTLTAALIRHRSSDPSQIAELDSILQRADKAEDSRNALTHSTWGAGMTADSVTRIKENTRKVKKGYQIVFQRMTVEDIEGKAREFAEIALQLQQFYIDLHEG